MFTVKMADDHFGNHRCLAEKNAPPISGVFDNIEYFSELYKWFNFDFVEK